MNKEIEQYLRNEVDEFEKEIEKTSRIMTNMIINCGKDDIGVNECIKTIKYYTNKKAKVINLLKML